MRRLATVDPIDITPAGQADVDPPATVAAGPTEGLFMAQRWPTRVVLSGSVFQKVIINIVGMTCQKQ